MVQDFDIEQFFQRGLDLLDTRVTKFDDFARVGEDYVVVLLDSVTLFILRNFITKLMLPHQVAIN
tara:strand:- start:28 stop:222 length:195 start_codon:yes stop_codon:yes gene_type:complete